MDHSRKHADQADPLRSLSRAIARGTFQVPPRPVQDQSPRPPGPTAAGGRGSGGGHGDQDDPTHRCRICSGPMPEEAEPLGSMCSAECRKRNANLQRNARKRDRLREARAGRACAFCGHPVPDEMKKGTKYCSPACRNAVRYGRALDRLAPRACDACGKRFEPFSPDQRHCCGECARVTRRGGARLDPRPCGHCGKVFRPRRAGVWALLFDVLRGQGRGCNTAHPAPAQAGRVVRHDLQAKARREPVLRPVLRRSVKQCRRTDAGSAALASSPHRRPLRCDGRRVIRCGCVLLPQMLPQSRTPPIGRGLLLHKSLFYLVEPRGIEPLTS